MISHNQENRIHSPYKAVWQIPKLIVKACTIHFNALNLLIVFDVLQQEVIKVRHTVLHGL